MLRSKLDGYGSLGESEVPEAGAGADTVDSARDQRDMVAPVATVAVVGIGDEKWGETPRAFVVLRHGANTTGEELQRFARSHLAHFNVPSSYCFVQELPKTATGKVQRFLLRQREGQRR